MAAKSRLIPSGAILVVLVAACSAYGDLSSGGVLSLDWLVDSSDEIHLVQYTPLESGSGLAVDLRQALKPELGKSSLDQDDLRHLRPPLTTGEAGEWIVFVRVLKDGRPRVVRGIDLDHPMASYNTAAFTRDGTQIRNRDAILTAVRSRIRLGRRLPTACNRFAVDEMTTLAPSNGKAYLPSSTYPFGDPAPLEQYLGGMLVRIDYDWDSENWLCVAVVPVEPEDHDRLLEAAIRGEQPEGSPRYCHPLPCLVNFPGKKTEKHLRTFARNRRLKQFLTATYVLRYFHYRLDVTDPLNRDLIGLWRLDGQRERIDVKLEKDNTFTASAADWNPSDYSWYRRELPRHTWQGQGYWVVRDGRLSIFRTDAGPPTQAATRKNEREIFADKPIMKVVDTKVVLKGGPPMSRMEAAEPPYANRPSPRHAVIRTNLGTCRRFRITRRLVFAGYEMVDGGSYAAEFHNQAGEKATLLFANRAYWTDEAKKQNIQPVLFHFYDEREKLNYYYEILKRSDEEQWIAALLRRATFERNRLKPDHLEATERLKWVEARLRDRQPVVAPTKE